MRAILSEHAEEQIVATDASVRLAQLSRAMPTGNLGVSGARGAGKTTLLRNICDARKRHAISARPFISTPP